MKILIAGFQHETNTFAPSEADWDSFVEGLSLIHISEPTRPERIGFGVVGV